MTAHLIAVGTGNEKKLDEIREILAPLGWDAVGVSELAKRLGRPPPTEPEEIGRTFAENARIKARAYAAQLGVPCLADDSGLEVDALEPGGDRPGVPEPGVWSARYAAEESGFDNLSRRDRDARNNDKLLKRLTHTPPEQRTARFVCEVTVLRSPDPEVDGPDPRYAGVLATARGTLEGRIGTPPSIPRGENGFGYDPIFLVGPHFERTSAELSPTEKNLISHRGEALRAIAHQLSRFT